MTSGIAASSPETLSARDRHELTLRTLNADETLVSDLLDFMSEGFVLFDAADRLVFCNETYRNFYSRIADILIPGVTFETLARVTAERGQVVRAAVDSEEFVRHRLRLHNLEHCIHEQKLCDGRWLRVTERRLQNGWVLGTRLDITGLKQREEALERARQQLIDALEALQEGFALFDAEDRLVLCNENYRKIFPLVADMIEPGIGFEDLIRSAADRGQNVEALEHRDAWIEARLSAHSQAEGTFEHQFSDGRHVWVSERKTRDGSTMSTYIDITALKRREQELTEAKVAAEKANRAKSEFLAKMSHELRTPLNAIIGSSDVIRKEMLGAIENQEYKEFAEVVYDSGSHLLTLINDLLDISKIESGESIAIHEDEVNLVAVFEACRRMVEQQAEKDEVRLVVEPPTDPQALVADGHALKRVLLNLLSNAIKFTPPGGSVDLSCGRSGANEIVLRVADTGIGMKKEDIPRALEPFVQLSSAPGKPGTGLGLPIAKHLVELHGGRLELESVLGQGTTISIILPDSRCRTPSETVVA